MRLDSLAAADETPAYILFPNRAVDVEAVQVLDQRLNGRLNVLDVAN